MPEPESDCSDLDGAARRTISHCAEFDVLLPSQKTLNAGSLRPAADRFSLANFRILKSEGILRKVC